MANTPECIRVYNTHAILEFPHVRLLWPPALSVCQTPRWWIPRSRHWIYYGWFQFQCSNHKQRNSLLDCARNTRFCLLQDVCNLYGSHSNQFIRDNIDMFNTYYNTLSERESSCSIHHETECSGILEEFPFKETPFPTISFIRSQDLMSLHACCDVRSRWGILRTKCPGLVLLKTKRAPFWKNGTSYTQPPPASGFSQV